MDDELFEHSINVPLRNVHTLTKELAQDIHRISDNEGKMAAMETLRKLQLALARAYVSAKAAYQLKETK